MARFEEALTKKQQKLPPLVDPQRTIQRQPKLTEAEAVTAFSQEQRRRVKQEKIGNFTGKRARETISCREAEEKELESQVSRTKRQRRGNQIATPQEATAFHEKGKRKNVNTRNPSGMSSPLAVGLQPHFTNPGPAQQFQPIVLEGGSRRSHQPFQHRAKILITPRQSVVPGRDAQELQQQRQQFTLLSDHPTQPVVSSGDTG